MSNQLSLFINSYPKEMRQQVQNELIFQEMLLQVKDVYLKYIQELQPYNDVVKFEYIFPNSALKELQINPCSLNYGSILEVISADFSRERHSFQVLFEEKNGLVFLFEYNCKVDVDCSLYLEHQVSMSGYTPKSSRNPKK